MSNDNETRLANIVNNLSRLLERSEIDMKAVLAERSILADKANSLARLVEQVAYAPVAGYYEAKGNDAPLRLLRLAVEDIDNLTKKGGAR